MVGPEIDLECIFGKVADHKVRYLTWENVTSLISIETMIGS